MARAERTPMLFLDHRARASPPPPEGPGGFIFVKNERNPEFAIMVTANNTIEYVKARILTLFGIPPDRQLHIYTFGPQVRRRTRRTINLLGQTMVDSGRWGSRCFGERAHVLSEHEGCWYGRAQHERRLALDRYPSASSLPS